MIKKTKSLYVLQKKMNCRPFAHVFFAPLRGLSAVTREEEVKRRKCNALLTKLSRLYQSYMSQQIAQENKIILTQTIPNGRIPFENCVSACESSAENAHIPRRNPAHFLHENMWLSSRKFDIC